jgi:polar amino acid transport system substrate-binding protein
MAVVAVAGFLLLLHMVQLMRYNAQLKRLSTTDSLTQLHNRHRMEEMLSEQRSLQERYDEPCGILLLDVDHFKQVNDRYGHQTGDRVLQEFAQLIRTNIRITDRACRWGGEEFLIICPQTNLEGTRALAEKLLEGIRTHEFPHGESMTGSIGLGMLQDEVALHHQLERIDNALYQAKNQGRNRVVGAS